jgi:excisionase family DNA binding protein
MNGKENLTVKEVSQEVGRKPKTIYRWIEEGYLKNVIKVRDGYLIPKTELERIKVIINREN